MNPPSISFVSLGCPKNLVDSEKMLGLLAEAGCPIVGDGTTLGEVMIVNTCGFLSDSRDEALAVLREAAEHKRAGRVDRLVVAGCLAQRDGRGLLQAVPEIDALLGVHHRGDILRAVIGDSAESGDRPFTHLGPYHPSTWIGANQSDRARLRLTPRHYAYLRVSEGCNQKCTFCTIPSIRGPMHCKPVDEIMAEARELIADGAREINLIGQDTTSYGRDIGYEPGLAGLLRTMNTLDGVVWLRLMYAYPSDFTDEMIDAVAECEKVAKYIDIPLQHINDRILRAMYRRVTRRRTESLLARLRERIDGVTIRTTLIAGFPGETEAEFEELRDFVADFGFDMLGVFPYSNEPGTPAHRMNEQLPRDVIEARVEELMRTQQRVAFAKAAARTGQRFRVMIDDCGENGVYPARHEGQAPEVDSLVHVAGGEYAPGEFLIVRCTGHRDYDLLAEPADRSLPVV
ncbi:MAG: 30S ribosomal protein S12 methylthiotransferase RimO [Phycisphaerae bacterium]